MIFLWAVSPRRMASKISSHKPDFHQLISWLISARIRRQPIECCSRPLTSDTLLTFIEETETGYRVGWYDHGHKYLQHFTDFSRAAADYLLFSFSRGRLRCQTI